MTEASAPTSAEAPTALAAPEAPAEATPLDFSQLEADVASTFGFGPEPAAQPPEAPATSAEPAPGVVMAPSPGAEPPPPGTPPTPAAPQPAPAPAPATPPASPPAAPTPAPAAPPAVPDDPALRSASLEAQVAALTQQLQELRASPPAGQQPPATPAAPGSDPAAALDQPVRYNLSLPEQVQQALSSDDPAQTVQAVSWVANAVASIVHHNLRQEFRPQFERLVNGLIGEAGQTLAEQQQVQTIEQAREQYYARFPDHKNPLIGSIVAAEAQKLATQYPHLQWNEQYMDSLGARVNQALATLRGEQAPPAEPPAPQPPARPASMLPANGPRPAVPAGGSAEDIIFETMAGGDFWGA